MKFFIEWPLEFLQLTIRVLPLFVVGAAAGAALRTFVPQRWSEQLFGRNRRGALAAAVSSGAVLPGCSCSTMPMAAGLREAGSSRLGTVAAFIFVSPLLSPITVMLTWGLLGWQMTIARVVTSLVGAYLVGMVVNRFESWFAPQPSPALLLAGAGSAKSSGPECCDPPVGEMARSAEAQGFLQTLIQVLRRIGPHFLIGMAVAAFLSVVLPEQAVPRFLGASSGPVAYLLAAVVGIPIYVCEGEEVPITYALVAHGLGPGPALTFLLGSVGTCVPTVLMSRGIIGNRATWFYVGFWVVFAIAAGLLFQIALA